MLTPGFLFRSLLRRFASDRRANVAMMFGLSLVPILIATGAGIDFARGVMVHQRMTQALDAAALAVGNATSKPSACSSSGNAAAKKSCEALQKTAQEYFNQNYDSSQNDKYGTPKPVEIDIAGQSVTLSSSLPLKLTLLGIKVDALNIASPTVTASSTVVWGQTKLWVSLVLDNSGSMANGDASGSKMAALKDAINNDTYGLLKTLQNAAASAGDVRVGVVPFTRSVNMGYSAFRNSNFIDWGEWEAPPANAGTISGNVGPGSNCPWATNTHGYRCTANSSNNAGNVSTIPASGLICPGIDNGDYNADHQARYYNGCFNSVPTRTLITTTDVSTPTTVRQNCTQTNANNNGPTTCTQASSSTGSSSTNTSTSTVNGYSGDSTNTSSSSSSTTSDGTKTCTGSGTNRRCTWVRTIVTTQVNTTVVRTAAAPYTHAWIVNSRDTWGGCVMDRQRKNKQTQVNGGTGWRTPSAYDYDSSNTQPSNTAANDDTQFPAENPSSCLSATVQGLSTDWSTLKTQIANMASSGATNQTIGVSHGFQMLTTGAPYGTGTLPDGTTKVMILFSDGLNTQNRWWGNGSSEGTTETGYIDARMKATCTAAKSAGIVIYAIYVHIGTNGSSAALQDCASGADKYYDLTSGAQIKEAFKDIAQKITNLRVSQ